MDSALNSALSSVKEARFSSRDLARLRTNDARLANRFIEIRGKQHPIIHLSIADTEIFRALSEHLDKLFTALADNNFLAYLLDNQEEITRFLRDEAPVAASIALRIPVESIKAMADPLTILRVVMRQWLHNLEIDRVQRLFPMPEDTEERVELPDAPEDNPTSLDERLCSNFHWSLQGAQSITYAQAYLLSNESAWSYARMKAKSDNDSDNPGSPKKVKVAKKANEKRFLDRFGDTPEERKANYKAYLEEQFGSPIKIKEVNLGKPEGE